MQTTAAAYILAFLNPAVAVSGPGIVAALSAAAAAWVWFWRRRWHAEAAAQRPEQAVPRRAVRSAVAGMALAVLLGTLGPASAQLTYTWNATTGSFQDGPNWLIGNTQATRPPGAQDTALFNGSGSRLVNFNSDWEVEGLTVTGNNAFNSVSFALNGHALTVGYLELSGAAGAVLTLSDGAVTNYGHVFIADNAILSLNRFTVAANSTQIVSGELQIGNGSTFFAGGSNSAFVGYNGGSAFVSVDGAGSAFVLQTSSFIGGFPSSDGAGTVDVRHGGSLRTTGTLSLAATAGSSGTVTLTDTGSSWTHTDGFITAGPGTTTLTVNPGTTLTVTGTSAPAGIALAHNATLNAAGTITVGGVGNSGITVADGGTLNVNALGTVTTQNLTRSGAGTIAFNGGTLVVNGGTFDSGGTALGVYGPGSVFQLQNGATATNSPGLFLGGGTATVNLLGGSTFTSGEGNVVVAFNGGSDQLNVLAGGRLNFTATQHNVYVGYGGGATGALVVDGAGSNFTFAGPSYPVYVGIYGGTGSLTVRNGGRWSQGGTQTILGYQSPSQGTLMVTGAGSRFDSSDVMYVGYDAGGVLTVSAGGTVTASHTVLGSASSSTGRMTVTGAGSRYDGSGNMFVGYDGGGVLTVSAGGAVTAAGVDVARNSGSTGSVVVTDPGSTWTISSGLFVGGFSGGPGGVGSLTIANGGAVTVTGDTKVWDNGILTINGGSLTTGAFIRVGDLELQNGTLTVDGNYHSFNPIFNNGGSFPDLAIQGNAVNTLATLRLVNGAYSFGIGNLSVGGSHPGALVLAGGASLSAFSVSAGTLTGGNGTITVTGANTQLLSTGPISLGATNGSGTLTIGTGAAVQTNDALMLNATGTVNLNGGKLTMASFTPNGRAFNWSSGTVLYGGDATVDGPQLTALLGTAGTLTAGHTLGNTSGTLTLTDNLTVAGGQLTGTINNTATLTVTAGGVRATGLTNSGLIVVSGGSVTATGISNSGEIQLASPAATIGAAGTTLTNTGRLDGTGRVNSDLVNNANGLIAVDAGQRLVFGGANNTNNLNGTISLTGGTVEFTAPLTNAAGGFISGRSTLRGNSGNSTVPGGSPTDPPVIDYGLKNSGVVAFSGGFSDVFGKVNNLGGSTGGQIINGGGGILTFHDDVVNNGKEIRTVAGGRTVFFGGASGAGPYTGTGTVEFDGDLRPGNSPARVTYAGDLVLSYSAHLQIELGGTIAGSQYDQVAVAGTAYLDGALDVVPYNGFVPQAGERFDIMTYGAHAGDFSTFTGLNLGNGLVLEPQVTGSNYSLVATAVPEPGTFALLGAAAAGLWRQRRRRAQ